MSLKFFTYSLGIFLLLSQPGTAQPPSKGIAEIDKAIAESKFNQADSILQLITTSYYSAGKADSLVTYILYVGKLEKAKSNADNAVKKVQLFVEKIKKLSSNPATLRQTYLDAGEFYGSVGLNKLAYKANEEAHKYTLLMPAKTGSDLGLVENNLSVYAQRLGDINLSKLQRRQAFKSLLSDKNPNYENLYMAYTGMGTVLWYGSKTDSALYYFNLALEVLKKTPRTPQNQYYRTAILLNNLSALYGQKGQTTQAIAAMKSTITNLKSFISFKEPTLKKEAAITFQFEATDNLAGIYKELGDLKKAQELLEYSYQQKQKILTPDNPAIFISQILLGQLYFATKDFDKSLQYLNKGLTKIAASDGDYLFWQADACNSLASLHDGKHNIKQATYFFEKADSLYRESLQGDYDDIYLDFLTNEAQFYAESGQFTKAITKANNGYNYVVEAQGEQTLPAFYQLMKLSEVYLLAGKYAESKAYSSKGLDVVNKIIKTSNNLLDSVKIELKKPRAILLKSKAEYQLLPQKTVSNLSVLLNQLNEALDLLERRKSIVQDDKSISLLMADHTDLLDFTKKITLDLYKLTNDQGFIDRLMDLHESGIYNRIRSRLDQNDSLQFADLPAELLAKEKQLKNNISLALDGEEPYRNKMQHYFTALDNWEQYKKKIRVNFPRYYQMRYASIFKTLGQTQNAIPESTTLIRYFFVEKELYALVADNKQKQIYALQKNGIEEQISKLSLHAMDANESGETLYTLYRQLWKPLEKSIHYTKVIVIPDGSLFNINFEILTPQKISSFREIATKSLLSKFTISYNYSLFLLLQKSKSSLLTNNFVGFAPGFSDKAKQNYQRISHDSSELDKGYLSLLPQPFSIDLAAKTQQLLGGNIYINDQSTEASFKANAGKNKIIHIGTHAESNNIYPQYSRLIFAKDTVPGEDNNSLYVDEIYNCDLTSNLAVLTACESGLPGYQDGEGMISLAHAFNYAGSESILTGLWKIDEQASTLILSFFYKNLVKGMSKDEALRQAKLSYLNQAEGRMLAPQYWAGLVLMGDSSPIVLANSKTNYTMWIVIGVIFLFFMAFISVKNISRKRAKLKDAILA